MFLGYGGWFGFVGFRFHIFNAALKSVIKLMSELAISRPQSIRAASLKHIVACLMISRPVGSAADQADPRGGVYVAVQGLLQLRIHFVGNGNNVQQHLAEIHSR